MTCAGRSFVIFVVVIITIEEPIFQRSGGRQPVEQAREELFRASGVGAVEFESGG